MSNYAERLARLERAAFQVERYRREQETLRMANLLERFSRGQYRAALVELNEAMAALYETVLETPTSSLARVLREEASVAAAAERVAVVAWLEKIGETYELAAVADLAADVARGDHLEKDEGETNRG